MKPSSSCGGFPKTRSAKWRSKGGGPSPSEPKSCACAEFGAEQMTALQSPIRGPLTPRTTRHIS
eukprot:5656312-Pyramimonas_sp.AAC.1